LETSQTSRVRTNHDAVPFVPIVRSERQHEATGARPSSSEAVAPGGRRRGTHPGAPQAVVDHLFSRLPGDELLNLGAGSTEFRRPGTLVVGVDLRPRESVGHNPFLVADAARLPFSSGVFVGALLKDIVEHVGSPIDVLREVRRVCRPSARIVVVTPRAIPRAVWDDPTHIRGFTARALTTALEESGWAPVRPPRRIGSLPGAGRLGLVAHLETILRLPGLGHWFGTNWCVEAQVA
jgi:SAM-dependent methyltransferase